MRPILATMRPFWPAIALVVLALGACSQPRPSGRPTVTPLLTGQAFPDKSAAALIKPDEGGTVSLREGAALELPRQALSAQAMVTLRALDENPPAPVPRSLIGRAYDVGLDGGDLIGVGTLTLPLPPGIASDQFDLAPYRWTGRAWERVEGKIAGDTVHLGIDQAGTFALLGAWRMADAGLTLTLPAAPSGQPAFPLEVRGQYQYRALPLLQHDYVEAKLSLKRDSSGGAGQVNGNDALDATVTDAVIWFKPDPSQAEGTIDFNYTFQVDPVALNVPLGSVNQFYVVLRVADSDAPTRRLSSAVDYVAQLPIRVEGTDVVRPAANTGQGLQWHVVLNGRTLVDVPAAGLRLSLAEILARGGLGEYHISLQTDYQGKTVAVSNEVSVQLALPSTVTPTPAAVSGFGSAWPFGTMPATPTRRTPPNGVPGMLDFPGQGGLAGTGGPVEPTATVTPAVTPTPTRPTGNVFWADTELLASPGACTTLHWDVSNIAAVYFEGAGTTGQNSKQVCLSSGKTYTLRTVDTQGSSRNYRVTVSIQGQTNAADIQFAADREQISQGECATLDWHVENVKQVFLNDQGVAGVATQQVCPGATTDYTLRVVDAAGAEASRRLTVWVAPAGKILIRFWADQYALPPGTCTTLHWAVDNVEAVYWRAPGDAAETGVAGHATKEVCPSGSGTYTIHADASGFRTETKGLTLQVGNPSLGSRELVAQGVVTAVNQVADLDPNTAGNLAGWRIDVDGISPLFTGYSGCCQSKMSLSILQGLVSGQYPTQVDWPLRPGQLIEFWLAPCGSAGCNVFSTPSRFYLKARSE
ncbi:MAG TPA: hypothetical protein VGA61_16755 [Anaerolineae bacterium]